MSSGEGDEVDPGDGEGLAGAGCVKADPLAKSEEADGGFDKRLRAEGELDAGVGQYCPRSGLGVVAAHCCLHDDHGSWLDCQHAHRNTSSEAGATAQRGSQQARPSVPVAAPSTKDIISAVHGPTPSWTAWARSAAVSTSRRTESIATRSTGTAPDAWCARADPTPKRGSSGTLGPAVSIVVPVPG